MHPIKNNLDAFDPSQVNILEISTVSKNFSNVGRAKSNSLNKTPEIKN